MDKPTLDPNASYVTASGGKFAGHNLPAIAAVKFVEEPTAPGEFTIEQGQQLLDSGKLKLATDVRPTPVEKPEDAVERLTQIEPMGDDTFLIRAPWLDAAETVTGEAAATARYAEVRAAGLEAYYELAAKASRTLSPANADAVAGAVITGGDGFSIVENGSNGYYDVVAPGREPEKVRGKANAEARLSELRIEAATPPADPPVVPAGDDTVEV